VINEERTEYKDPDLLSYDVSALTVAERGTLEATDLVRQPRIAFDRRAPLGFVLEKALAALEVEFSPYKAKEMKGRHWKPKTVEKWRRRPSRHAKPPSAPNIFVKEEDLPRLIAWEERFRVPIMVVHLFDQEGFAICLREIASFNQKYEKHRSANRKKLQMTTGFFKKMQPYDRVDAQGAREKKPVINVAPSVAVKVGDLSGIEVSAEYSVSASKKYVSHVLFSRGSLSVSPEFLALLRSRCENR